MSESYCPGGLRSTPPRDGRDGRDGAMEQFRILPQHPRFAAPFRALWNADKVKVSPNPNGKAKLPFQNRTLK